MRSEHATFEALAGAVALGEAGPAEQLAFHEHAATCAACAEAAAGASLLAELAQTRDAELWRPQIGDSLSARIRETRSRSAGRLFGALGYAAGLSIALNIAIVTGFAGRLYERLATPNAIPVPAAAQSANAVVVAPPVISVAPPRYVLHPLGLAMRSRPAHPARNAAGRLGDVPDVLAGLVQPATVTAARDVAQENEALCASALTDLGRGASCAATRADRPR